MIKRQGKSTGRDSHQLRVLQRSSVAGMSCPSKRQRASREGGFCFTKSGQRFQRTTFRWLDTFHVCLNKEKNKSFRALDSFAFCMPKRSPMSSKTNGTKYTGPNVAQEGGRGRCSCTKITLCKHMTCLHWTLEKSHDRHHQKMELLSFPGWKLKARLTEAGLVYTSYLNFSYETQTQIPSSLHSQDKRHIKWWS